MKFDAILDELKVDAILVTDGYNLRYFSKFRGGEGTLVITRNTKTLIVDSRYTEAAKEESDFRVVEFNRENPRLNIINDIIALENIKVMGFEDRSMLVSDYSEYLENLKGLEEFVPVKDALLKERSIKTEEELSYLKKAEEIGDMAFSDILGIIKPGMTELEIACELEYSMKRHGAGGFSFDTIVASGIHSSMPHAIPSEKKIENGDFITMDFGCLYNGYCSDMTRTVVCGKASNEQKEIYNIVLKANEMAEEAIRPGMMCKEADKIARDYIESKGYGKYFGHGLGHSVGLFIHESPALNMRDETILKPGMIETVEPGIYLPGKCGVRIEDMGVITENGYVRYSNSPKELIEL